MLNLQDNSLKINKKIINLIWTSDSHSIGPINVHLFLAKYLNLTSSVKTFFINGINHNFNNCVFLNLGIKKFKLSNKLKYFIFYAFKKHHLDPYDLIIVDGFQSLQWLLYYQKDSEIKPTIFVLHGIPSRKKPINILNYYKNIIVVCVSKTTHDYFITNHPEYRNISTFINNGTDYLYLDKFFMERLEAKKKLDIPENQFTIVSICRLEASKNLFLLLHAIALLNNSLEFKLLIYGDGSLYEELNNEILRLSITNCVELKGHIDNPAHYASAFDLMVAPYINEGFGLSVAEMAGMGVPTICADQPNFRLLFERTGIYFDPYNAQALANLLEHFITSDQDRINCGRLQMEYLRTHFDANKTTGPAYLQLIETHLDAK